MNTSRNAAAGLQVRKVERRYAMLVIARKVFQGVYVHQAVHLVYVGRSGSGIKLRLKGGSTLRLVPVAGVVDIRSVEGGYEAWLSRGAAFTLERLALVKLLSIGDERVHLGFQAPREIRILRDEVFAERGFAPMARL